MPRLTEYSLSLKEANEVSCKINWSSLNSCPPYTEIFSKRRKIYTVCVEGLSIVTSQVRQIVFLFTYRILLTIQSGWTRLTKKPPNLSGEEIEIYIYRQFI